MTEPRVEVQGTPNPNAAKFVVTPGGLGSESRAYFRAEDALGDRLATRLFEVTGVRALLIVEDFVTVTKSEDVEWDDMVEEITCVIQDTLAE